MITYGDIFVEVRQRVAAFRYFKEFTGDVDAFSYMDEPDYLDEAYRFLYSSASKSVIAFCAGKEGMTFDNYCSVMGVKKEELM